MGFGVFVGFGYSWLGVAWRLGLGGVAVTRGVAVDDDPLPPTLVAAGPSCHDGQVSAAQEDDASAFPGCFAGRV